VASDTRLHQIARLARAVSSALELESVLREVASAVAILRPDACCAIRLVDPAAGGYRLAAWAGSLPMTHVPVRPFGEGVTHLTAAGRAPVLIDDLRGDPRVRDRRWFESRGFGVYYGVPVVVGDAVVAVVNLTFAAGTPPTLDEQETIEVLAEHAAVAIHNARLFEESERRRRAAEAAEQRAGFLVEAGTLLASSLDYELTLARLARLAVPRLADLCAVDIVDGASIRRVAVAHVDPGRERLVREVRERHGFNMAAPSGVPRVLRTGEPAFVPDVTDADLAGAATSDEQLELFRALGMRAWIIVPLIARGQVLGALTLAMAESGRRYEPSDLVLARALAERAAMAIDHAELYRAARAASRAKDDFLATVSHELRTPLTSIYGWVRLVRSGGLDAPTVERALEAIERNARAQGQLIDDLLDLSRIVAGKMRLDVRAVDLPGVVQAALETIRPAADAKALRLATVLDPRAAPIMGDPDRLQQVAWNLLANAVKFTPRGGRIEVALRRVNSHVELLVSDTGVGLATEDLSHIFDRFRQGGRATPSKADGLGLGLALVRHLVELHGGTVAAQSAGPGQGATFVVCLPVSLALGEAPALEAGAGPAAPLPSPSLAGLLVLAVDDDRDSLELVQQILRMAGAEVRTAGSGGEALALLDAWSPEVILLDVEMPGEDGYMVIGKLRTREPSRGGRVPVVAVTAYASPRDRIRALAAGFNLLLPKPVEPAELLIVVANLTGRVFSRSGDR
jgi:signal transduction histidine kinase/ActR/RegA family two-component response regulator